MMHNQQQQQGTRGYHRVPTTAAAGNNNDDNTGNTMMTIMMNGGTGHNVNMHGAAPNNNNVHNNKNTNNYNRQSGGGDDCLQQSLLISSAGSGEEGEFPSPPVSPSNPHSFPPRFGGRSGADGGGGGYWHSPQQLYCVLESFLESWNIIFPYIRPMGNFLYAITILTMLVVVPMVTYTAIKEHRFDFAAFDSSGVMVLGTLVLSCRLVYLHLSHWYMPEVQKYVVRIVWMVPLYAVQSWLSLRFRDSRVYIDAIRDLYEAFVIASFLYYLIELLGGQDALVRTLESKRETQPHLGKQQWPINHIIKDWEMGLEFMLQCKHGVLQYVVIKTVATILTYMFEIMGCYGEGEFQWNRAYPYLAFILNTSVMYALYVLVMLFHAVNDELIHPINWRPLGKFLCVKGVVFFTWWQGVIIFYLQSKGFIKDAGDWKSDEIANAVIDYCICTEMVFFAIAHSYTFSYKEYLPSSIPPELRNLTANAHINAHHRHTHAGTAPTLRLEPVATRRTSSSSVASLPANSSSNTTTSGSVKPPNYCPPAMLDRPLKFNEAFRSSIIPKETLADIQRLRNGIDTIVRGDNPTGCISLQEIQSEADGVMACATANGNEAEAAAAAEVAALAANHAAASQQQQLQQNANDIQQPGNHHHQQHQRR